MDIVDVEVKQPEHFAFTAENEKQTAKIIARYPSGKQASAVMPLLALAQKQHDNWLPKSAMDAVAEMLDMSPIRVYEVATFYSMYNLAPVGKHFIQLCTTTPCWLRGSNDIVKACEDHLGIKIGGTTQDGQFTLKEVECLGACVNAPMAQIGDEFYEDLNTSNVVELLQALKRGETPKAGSQSGRKSSEPQTGSTTLKNKKTA
jgi:NADH-quinone oxidoreductase E subunit